MKMKYLLIFAAAVLFVVPLSNVRAQESLGDAARKVKPRDAQTTSKRVFTDDDVAHANPNQVTNPPTSSTDVSDRIRDAQKLIDKLSAKKQRELANGVVGEIKFPERDNWEQRFAEQSGRLLQAAQTVVDTVRKAKSDSSSEEEKANARGTRIHILNDLDFELARYNRLVAEGIQKASDWERKR